MYSMLIRRLDVSKILITRKNFVNNFDKLRIINFSFTPKERFYFYNYVKLYSLSFLSLFIKYVKCKNFAAFFSNNDFYLKSVLNILNCIFGYSKKNVIWETMISTFVVIKLRKKHFYNHEIYKLQISIIGNIINCF